MGLVGRLEDLALPDILQIISLTQKTGRLTLTRREGSGVVIFRKGQVMYAASDSIRDTLGNLLVCEKLITESILMTVLEQQHRAESAERVGTIVVEKGYVKPEAVEKVVRAHVERVMYEFLVWRKGFFKFDVFDIPEGGQVEVEARDFLLTTGLDTNALRLEGLKRLEQQKRQPLVSPAAVTADPGTPAPTAPVSRGPSLSLLKAAMAGARTPGFLPEVPNTVMRLAAEVADRGVLFRLTKTGICGIGQFGVGANGGQPDDTVKKIVIPINQPSLFSEVIATKQPYRGKLEPTAWNEFLVKKLGGTAPQEVVAVPLVVDGNVAMIFYGDTGVKNRPIRDADCLELFMLQAGLAVEKDRLVKKMETLERPAARP